MPEERCIRIGKVRFRREIIVDDYGRYRVVKVWVIDDWDYADLPFSKLPIQPHEFSETLLDDLEFGSKVYEKLYVLTFISASQVHYVKGGIVFGDSGRKTAKRSVYNEASTPESQGTLRFQT